MSLSLREIVQASNLEIAENSFETDLRPLPNERFSLEAYNPRQTRLRRPIGEWG